jgi:hypothetical protein
MKIRMRQTAAGPMGSFQSGLVYDTTDGGIPPEFAATMLDCGAAVEVPAEVPELKILEDATSKVDAESRSSDSPETDEEGDPGAGASSEDAEGSEGQEVPGWPLRITPEKYLERYAADAKYANLAREVVSFHAAAGWVEGEK